jgi:hypothetical protein
MDVDNPVVDPDRESDVDSIPTSPLLFSSPQTPAEASSSQLREASKPGDRVDIEMQDASGSTDQVILKTTRSLPPRKTAGTSDSSMMFGKYGSNIAIV